MLLTVAQLDLNFFCFFSALVLCFFVEGVKGCDGYCSSNQQKCLKDEHMDSGYNMIWSKELARFAKKEAKSLAGKANLFIPI